MYTLRKFLNFTIFRSISPAIFSSLSTYQFCFDFSLKENYAMKNTVFTNFGIFRMFYSAQMDIFA